MIDPEDRLYHDSVLVRFEDGKLNGKATFTALAEFLDLPYTESLSVCSECGKPVPYLGGNGYAPGFSPDAVYRTYDDFINDSEGYFIEYFLRDAYEHYGYDFQYYDGAELSEESACELIRNFERVNHYMGETWREVYKRAHVSTDSGAVTPEIEASVQEKLLENHMQNVEKLRFSNVNILLEGLRFVNKNGQPLYMMPKLKLDPGLLEQPLYH